MIGAYVLVGLGVALLLGCWAEYVGEKRNDTAKDDIVNAVVNPTPRELLRRGFVKRR